MLRIIIGTAIGGIVVLIAGVLLDEIPREELVAFLLDREVIVTVAMVVNFVVLFYHEYCWVEKEAPDTFSLIIMMGAILLWWFTVMNLL